MVFTRPAKGSSPFTIRGATTIKKRLRKTLTEILVSLTNTKYLALLCNLSLANGIATIASIARIPAIQVIRLDLSG